MKEAYDLAKELTQAIDMPEFKKVIKDMPQSVRDMMKEIVIALD